MLTALGSLFVGGRWRRRCGTARFRAASSIALAVALAFAASGCGATGEDGEDADGRLRVVTTVSPITSLAESVGGGLIRLKGIVPEGADSHTFEPAPSAARAMAEADLILLNGLFLEEPALAMARASKKAGAVILPLGDRTLTRSDWAFDASFPESEGRPNPHLWTSPPLALRYAALIRDELSALDAANADAYAANYARLRQRLEDLDRRIAEAVATIPPANRKLLTYHDSFPYFAQHYGLEIIAAVQPSDFTEPSARSVAALIEQVREAGVPAVFGSEVFPSPVMERVAEEGGAAFVAALRDDDLPGKPGDPRHSYAGLMLANVEAMVPALGGSADALAGFDAGAGLQTAGGAAYPQ